ncbi:MAG: HNH endonuclease, partial [Actinomycetota bacterium]|nr:HNH endonuclease [Actinomycetota bacterium]
MRSTGPSAWVAAPGSFPNRTRLAIEERDGGCRVPGCDRTRWLHVHHVVHWEDGGATDTSNLMSLCSNPPRTSSAARPEPGWYGRPGPLTEVH